MSSGCIRRPDLLGIGDFLIQHSARSVGDWETLLAISLLGAVVLTPFVYRDLHVVSFNAETTVLFGVSIALLIAALFDFEGLKRGKFAVVEPVLTMESQFPSFLQSRSSTRAFRSCRRCSWSS